MLLLHPNWEGNYRSIIILLMEDDYGNPIYAQLRHIDPPEEASKHLMSAFAGKDITHSFPEKRRKWVILRVDPYDPDTDPARSDT